MKNRFNGMTKEEVIAIVNQEVEGVAHEMYMDYIHRFDKTIEQFKNTDAGRYGKALEINVKQYLNGNRGNSKVVSAKGKTDVTHKGVKYEIKSNCGEINENIMTNDFIIYSYDNKSDWNKPDRCHVIPTADFIKELEKLGMIRTKKSSNGQLKTAIQSYANSKRKLTAWIAAVNQYPTLAELRG